MYIQRLRLRHFRTYSRLDLHLRPGVTLFQGPNAAGKTNILEAIYLLGTTKSFRTRTDRELISWENDEESLPRYARIEGECQAKTGPIRVEAVILEQERSNGEMAVRKQLKVDGRPRRGSDVVGNIKVVLFSPDDVALVTGSPSFRRRYMDVMLCQVDHRYLRLLQEYGQVVTQRNALLQRLRGRPEPITLLEFWDEKLVTTGVEIMAARKGMLRMLSDFGQEGYADLAGPGETFEIGYKPSLDDAHEAQTIELPEMFYRRLAQLQTKEIHQGVTLVGPHRDDLQLLIDGVEAQYFGSRGQQRTVALALRLAELRYMTNRSAEQPILLLDEAVAELDADRRELLHGLMETHPQVLVTTANPDAFPVEFQERATLAYVEPGKVTLKEPERARAS